MEREWAVGAMLILTAFLPARAEATATGVKPAGSPGEWITSEDYPVSALRSGVTGSTKFRLDVDTQGKVAACTVTRSSGSVALDTATCSILSARAHFVPATDAAGKAIASAYSSTVRWQIPNDGGIAMARAHFESCRMRDSDAIVVETAFGCAY